MRILPALVLFVSLGLSAPAAAQPQPADPDPPEVKAARDGGEEGLHLFMAGKWEEAYNAFRRADRLYHAPTLVLYMAHCLKRLNRLSSARTLYRTIADERMASTAPLQFLTAQMMAREEADHLEARVPTLSINLTGGWSGRAHVRVDGELTAPSVWQKLPLDPGSHVVEVRDGDGPPIQRSVNLKEGTTLSLSISPAETPSSGAPAAPPAARPEAPRPDAPGSDPSRGHPPSAAGKSEPSSLGPLTPALIAFGAGAAALGVGTATGVVSLGKAAAVKASCRPDRTCPASEQATATTAGQLADASTVAFVVAGAAVAAGVVLVVVRPGSARLGAQPAVGVGLGPRSLFVNGRF